MTQQLGSAVANAILKHWKPMRRIRLSRQMLRSFSARLQSDAQRSLGVQILSRKCRSGWSSLLSRTIGRPSWCCGVHPGNAGWMQIGKYCGWVTSATLSKKCKVCSLWRAAAHTTQCDVILGLVSSHWHADSRVVLLPYTGRTPTFQGRNLSLTCRFQGRTFAVQES